MKEHPHMIWAIRADRFSFPVSVIVCCRSFDAFQMDNFNLRLESQADLTRLRATARTHERQRTGGQFLWNSWHEQRMPQLKIESDSVLIQMGFRHRVNSENPPAEGSTPDGGRSEPRRLKAGFFCGGCGTTEEAAEKLIATAINALRRWKREHILERRIGTSGTRALPKTA